PIHRAEVDLVEHLTADVGQGLTKQGEGVRLGGGQVEVVDPVVKGLPEGVDALLNTRARDGAGPQSGDADPVAGAAVDAIFHVQSPPRFSLKWIRNADDLLRTERMPL